MGENTKCFFKFKIALRPDVYEPISLKLGMAIDMTKLYILIPV